MWQPLKSVEVHLTIMTTLSKTRYKWAHQVAQPVGKEMEAESAVACGAKQFATTLADETAHGQSVSPQLYKSEYWGERKEFSCATNKWLTIDNHESITCNNITIPFLLHLPTASVEATKAH